MKNIIEFIKRRHELYLILIAIAFMLIAQVVSSIINPDYASFGISWLEDLFYEHVKAFNVFAGIYLLMFLVFRGGYKFLGTLMENLIDTGTTNGGKETLTLWQRSLLSLALFALLILLYIGT